MLDDSAVYSQELINKASQHLSTYFQKSGSLESDSVWRPEKNASRPRALSKLSAFISCAEDTNYLSEFKKMTEQLLEHLQRLWPDTEFLDLYPVFENMKK